MAACAFMTAAELNALARTTTHKFFELMVPSATRAAICASSPDGRATCVCTGKVRANVLRKPASLRAATFILVRFAQRS
jgi:hypothetical protein